MNLRFANPPPRAFLLWLALAATLGSAGLAVAGQSPLDNGTLDPEWFGGEKEFRRTSSVDYLWVKPGFSVDDHTFHFEAWPTPVFIGPDAGTRDNDDMVLARQISGEMPALLELQFDVVLAGRAEVSLEEGEVLVSGRIVDCTRGNQMVKFLAPTVAGKGLARIDLKFVDKESGELLAGLHTRVTSGTALTNTWNKMVKWVRRFSSDVGEKGFQTMYQKGKRVKD
jgi:hypothetical protein